MIIRTATTCWILLLPLAQLAADTIDIPDAQVSLIHEITVPTVEAGLVREISVREGDLVAEGDPLARLDEGTTNLQRDAAALEAEIAVRETENDVDARYARKSMEVRKADVLRAQEAVRQYAKSISESELAQLRLEAERAILAAEQAERVLEQAELTAQLRRKQVEVFDRRLQLLNITAPSQGLVVDVYRNPGEWVVAGGPMLRLIRLDQLRVEGFVDASRVAPSALDNARATLSVNLPPAGDTTQFSGRVVFVSPEVQPVTNQVRVWAEIENPNLTLRPGTRGQLQITAE